MKRGIIIITTGAIAIGAIGFLVTAKTLHQSHTTQPTTITLNNTVVALEIADTPAKQQQGLSGRSSLAENHGMLFIYDHDDYYAFWMPNMNFAIDIVWFDANWKIVSIEKNITPETYPKTFSPTKLARYVLEVPTGFSAQHQLVAGDQATVK